LGPFKVEVTSFSPYISIYHDILTETEMKWMKDYSTPRLSKSREASIRGSYVPALNKGTKIVHKTVQCWFSDGEFDSENRFTVKDPIVFGLTKKLERATGLNLTSRNGSLPYQTTNYGLGGLCERHMDSYGSLEEQYTSPNRRKFGFSSYI
jgi:hypothetical protein